MRHALIMAGGSGTRLWPMSTRDQPKQLIRFLDGQSLLEAAADRLEGLVEKPRRYIGTGEALREPIRRALPDFDDAHILGEPARRDTLNAVGLAAAVIGKSDPDAVIAVLTADQIFKPVEIFQDRVRRGYELVERHPEMLVTFGITPTEPSTGFGYVHRGEAIADCEHCYRVIEFKEKPDAATAKQYVDSGEYLWNGGMFVWRADTLLQYIAEYQPQAHAGLEKIREAWGTAEQQDVLNKEYPLLPKISVDYAVMEPSSRAGRVATVDLPIEWIDVGSWTSYAEVCRQDESDNAIGGVKTLLNETRNCIVAGSDPDHLIATMGVEGLIVIHTPKATLVCRKEDEQRIKQLHAEIAERCGDEYV